MPTGTPKLSLCVLEAPDVSYTQHSLSPFVLFDTVKYSRFIFYFPDLALESAIFARSPAFFPWKMVFRNQDLSAGFAHAAAVSLLVVPLSRYVHIQIAVFIPVKNHEFVLLPSTAVYHSFLFFPFSLFVIPLTKTILAAITFKV